MKILFYAPHSAIWVHAFPEALVAESLAKSGHEVVYVTCGRLLDRYCVAMSAAGVAVLDAQEKKQAVCATCTARRDLIRSKFGFAGYDLAERVSAEDRATVRGLLGAIDRKRVMDLEVEGIPVGAYALYEFLLERKKGTLTFDATEWSDYLLRLEAALLSLHAAKRILGEEKPDRLVVYNALYSSNRVACELAERMGVATYFLHAGLNFSSRLQTLLLGKRNPFHYYADMIAAWPHFRSMPCDPRMMSSIAEHILVLIRGTSPFGYSSAVRAGEPAIRERFGIRADQRVLVASMSSNDERFAAESGGALAKSDGLLFPQQLDWIASVVDYVRRRPELFLIVRVHPRDFPNRRESTKSEHANLLEGVLRNLPPNVSVNWPSDGISLFEVACEADVFLNAWSAVGKEVGLLGIPVVLYAPTLVAYPPDLNYFATTLEGYYAAIEQALADGWSAERARMTFRWLAVEYGYGLVGIGDAFRRSEAPSRHLIRRITRRLLRAIHADHAEWLDCVRRPARLAAARDIAEILEERLATPCALQSHRMPARVPALDEETAGLRSQLQRIGKTIFSTAAHSSHSLLERNLGLYLQEKAGAHA